MYTYDKDLVRFRREAARRHAALCNFSRKFSKTFSRRRGFDPRGTNFDQYGVSNKDRENAEKLQEHLEYADRRGSKDFYNPDPNAMAKRFKTGDATPADIVHMMLAMSSKDPNVRDMIAKYEGIDNLAGILRDEKAKNNVHTPSQMIQEMRQEGLFDKSGLQRHLDYLTERSDRNQIDNSGKQVIGEDALAFQIDAVLSDPEARSKAGVPFNPRLIRKLSKSILRDVSNPPSKSSVNTGVSPLGRHEYALSTDDKKVLEDVGKDDANFLVGKDEDKRDVTPGFAAKALVNLGKTPKSYVPTRTEYNARYITDAAKNNKLINEFLEYLNRNMEK